MSNRKIKLGVWYAWPEHPAPCIQCMVIAEHKDGWHKYDCFFTDERMKYGGFVAWMIPAGPDDIGKYVEVER